MGLPNTDVVDVPPAFTRQELLQLRVRAEYWAAMSDLAESMGGPWRVAFASLAASLDVLDVLYEEVGESEARIYRWLRGNSRPGKL